MYANHHQLTSGSNGVGREVEVNGFIGIDVGRKIECAGVRHAPGEVRERPVAGGVAGRGYQDVVWVCLGVCHSHLGIGEESAWDMAVGYYDLNTV